MRIGFFCTQLIPDSHPWAKFGSVQKVSSRGQNERKFDSWKELPNGGRVYSPAVNGRHGWVAIYPKQINPMEQTERFWQEIFNPEGVLTEVHEKFPVDKGHQKV